MGQQQSKPTGAFKSMPILLEPPPHELVLTDRRFVTKQQLTLRLARNTVKDLSGHTFFSVRPAAAGRNGACQLLVDADGRPLLFTEMQHYYASYTVRAGESPQGSVVCRLTKSPKRKGISYDVDMVNKTTGGRTQMFLNIVTTTHDVDLYFGNPDHSTPLHIARLHHLQSSMDYQLTMTVAANVDISLVATLGFLLFTYLTELRVTHY
nr:hypothetical protein HK105_004769 [Polyrhizophydium stewartii]